MTRNPESVYIEFMGCGKRGLDAAKFKDYFMANGVRLESRPHNADCILYISCAYVKERQTRAIKRIQKLQKYKGELIVAGCLKAINQDLLDKHFSGRSLTTARHHDIDKLFPQFKVSFNDIPDANFVFPIKKTQFFWENIFAFRFDINFFKCAFFFLKRRFSNYYWHIRICWGCEKEHCAFCVIWRAIGPLHSKPIETCIVELKKALAKRKRRIILLASNTGAYGSDIGRTLPDLLEAMISVDENFTIEIEDFHPFWLIKYREKMVDLLRTGRIVALNCPVQSGSDRILALMNRRYTAKDLRESLMDFKDAYPPLEINTQILVGFFSETEADFEQSLALLAQVKFRLVQMFGFTKHPSNNHVVPLASEVPEAVIQQRLRKAVKFCRKHKILCATA